MERLRVGILGCGGIAGFHAGRLTSIDRTEVVGLVDPSPQSIEGLRERVPLDGVPAFGSADELYAGVQVDAVVVATPHSLHHPLIMQALGRGLHVLCEKPLACTPQEARDIAGAATAAGLTVTVSYQRRFDPGYLYLRDAIDGGGIGELRAVSITCGQHWDEWTRAGWRQVPELSGGGMLMDTGSHLVDVLCWLAGRPFEEVQAIVQYRGRPVDIDTNAIVRFEGELQAQLTVLGQLPFTFLEDVLVTGTDGSLRYQNDPQHPWRQGQVTRYTMDGETRPLNLPRGGDDVVSAWVAAVRGERENPIPPEAGVRVAELTHAIMEAGREAVTADR